MTNNSWCPQCPVYDYCGYLSMLDIIVLIKPSDANTMFNKPYFVLNSS